MPIEVRELIIRTVVNSADEKTTSGASGVPQASKKSVSDGLETLAKLIQNRNER